MNPSQDNKVTFCAVGDVALCDSIEQKMSENGLEYPFSKIHHVFQGNDINSANLENVFCQETEGLNAQAHLLRCSPQHASSLSYAGFDVVSLANNHIMDYGLEGLQETLSHLDSLQIMHNGAGANLAEARMPSIIERKGIRFGFLSYAMKGVQSAIEDDGGASWINLEMITEDITTLQSKVNHIVVSLHAGLEFIDFPHPDHRKICHEIAKLGVSLIIGHHPHVIHGVEKKNNCLIAYSLGNLVFDMTLMDYKTEMSQQGFILKALFNEKQLLDYEIIPTVIGNDFRPYIPAPPLNFSILKRIENISEALATDEYPSVYFKQASAIWPKINIAVNIKIIREQGLRAFLKRIPRIKKIYIILLLKYLFKKGVSIFTSAKSQ